MIVEYKSFDHKQSTIAFCIVDRTKFSATSWIKEIVKNQSDYTLNNIVGKQYDVYQGTDEDLLLKHVAECGYGHAVVLSTGTEFINGHDFFNEIETITSTEYSIAGHILDRGDAYYELHHQCYLINLKDYKELGYPFVGKQELGSKHKQVIPLRSIDNIHDDYTPIWVEKGSQSKIYNHKCHGWNLLKSMFEHDKKLIVFNENIRNNKIHLYPEHLLDFNRNINTIYQREYFCATEFIHTANTEWQMHIERKYKQVLTPASGLWYKNFVTPDAKIIFYDYNKNALTYWQNQVPTATFIHIDLINGDFNIADIIDLDLVDDTIINLSNIFCYEGTSHFYSTDYKISRENLVLQNIKDYAPTASLYYSNRAAGAFDSRETLHGELTSGDQVKLTIQRNLKTPTWHFSDWL
jgi:hypothetical protein